MSTSSTGVPEAAPQKPPMIEVTLTPQHIGELAVLSQSAAASAFADRQFERAARHYRAASKLCAALAQDTSGEEGHQ